MRELDALLEEGQTVGQYRVERLLGTGGLGAVYLARDTVTERRVALKAVSSNLSSVRARFAREARLLSTFRHPNAASYIDFLDEGERSYLVLEYVDHAVSLGDWQRGRELREVFLAYAIIARTLTALHEQGLVHRDLKPSNVLVREGREPVVIDFGLAIQEKEDDELTGAGTLIGTPAFLAPEALGERRLGPPADIYSFGLMLFEALTGHLPEGETTSIHQLLSRRLAGNTQRLELDLRLLEKVLGPSIAELISRTLSLEPERRPIAQEVALALQSMTEEPRQRKERDLGDRPNWAPIERHDPRLRPSGTQAPRIKARHVRAVERSNPGTLRRSRKGSVGRSARVGKVGQ